MVGKNAPGGWKVGDRAAGFVHGGIYEDRGSFAEYLKIDGDLAWKIPEGMRDEQAATYGVSAVTAMLALNVHLGIPWFDEAVTNDDKQLQVTASGNTVFIYADSTAVGLFALQLAKRAGYTVVTTASPHSFDLVRRYGADSVFDYRSTTAIQDIATAYPDITLSLDCISEGPSTDFCAQVIKRLGGKVVTLLDRGKSKTEGVQYDFIVVYTVFNQSFAWLPPIGPKFPSNPSDRKALVAFYATLPRHIKELKPPPVRTIRVDLMAF
jgi:NADPH:quinone reductase-like Zn-dependent oxidoreductase